MGLKQIKPALKQYLAKVRQNIPIEKAILFGSYAHGRAKTDSDVDLIILSSKFHGMEDDERLRLLYRLSVGFPYNLHVYGLTEEELNQVSPLTTLAEARKTGVVISE